MAHNIDMTNGRANIAFLGSRDDVWHKLGQEMKPGMSVEDWAKAAGLDWHAVKVAAYAHLPEGVAASIIDVPHGRGSRTENGERLIRVDGVRHIVRSDNGHVLGTATDRYQPHQPAELLDWFKQYISVDDRFQIDVAGSLKQGEIIWATATFNGGMDVAGDKHVARLLMTTTFDATGATINQGTMERAVCRNTLKLAMLDKRAVVKTRHNTRFDAARVGKELAGIAQGFDTYKAMGDAMGKTHISREQVSKFFKTVLEIPFDVEKKDISTRKLNQFQELGQAYAATVREGTEPETMWTALNAVTRYVDHDRSTRGGNGEGRFLSAQFGSGAAMKEKAVATLFEMSDGELLKAVSAKTVDDADLSAILKQPLRASVGA